MNKIELLLANHNAHATLLELIRSSKLDDLNKAHIVNEIFYNYFSINVLIHNDEVDSINQLLEQFDRFEQRIDVKIQKALTA